MAWLRFIIATFVLLLVIVVGWLWNSQSVRDGDLNLIGLRAQVHVRFDEWGIPHIFAEHDLDGFQALGFVHAQDRLFQMDMLRRVGLGELSALLGEDALSVDRYFRTFGTHLVAQQRAERLRAEQPHIVDKIEAYYRGVNQAIDQLPLPLEYQLLGAKPEPFTVVDAYGIAAYMGHSFLAGLRTDSLLTAVQQKVSPQHFARLVVGWPGAASDQKSMSAQGAKALNSKTKSNQGLSEKSLLALNDGVERLAQLLPFGHIHGSNAWVVAAEKTKSGSPLLANDPHMEFSVPAVWYEAQLHTDRRNVYGHFAAGLPFPVLMRSAHHAHGLTMLQSDDADVFALDVHPQDNGRVMVEGQWESLQVRKEVIEVKGHDSVTFEVQVSSLGPIVNELLGETDSAQYLAFYWLFTHPDNDAVTMMHRVMEADDLSSMEAAVAPFISPGLNILYADRDNNIAQWAAGRFVQRPQGQNGKLIVNGSRSGSAPLGLLPFDRNPKQINPTQGYLVSTNDPQLGSDPTQLHQGYYSAIYRSLTAQRAFLNEESWSVEKAKLLQTNDVNARWQTLRPIMHALLQQELSESEQQALSLLLEWDGQYAAANTEAAPVIFERFYFHLLSETFSDELGEALWSRFINNSITDNTFYILLHNPEDIWWDNINTPQRERQLDILVHAFSEAMVSLQEDQGVDPSQWQWESMAQLTHPHPLGVGELLSRVFNVRAYRVNGSKHALNNMKHEYSENTLRVSNGPSTRRVVDLADMSRGWNANPVGQSGRIMDRHYSDQADLYHQNRYRQSRMMSLDDDDSQTQLNLMPVD